ncbi:MAG: chemotaxis protein CheX [Campylobacterales bacterium]
MIETLSISSKDVFKNSVGLEIEKCNEELKSGYVSTIGFKCGNVDTLSFVFEKELLEEVGELMMIGSDEEAIIDLSCELANLIAGHAKVLIKDKGSLCDISTPNFFGKKDINSGNTSLSFLCNGSRFSIFLGRCS